MRNLFVLVLFFFVLSGCNAIKGTQFPDNYTEQLPSAYSIKKFPHIRQNDNYSCATTSLAMVMSYYDGNRYQKSEVWDASGSSVAAITARRTGGNDMPGLGRASEAFGFTNYEFVQGMTLDQLKYLITQDIPVVVNIRNFSQPYYHAVVAIGYDDSGVIFADPAYWGASYHKDYGTFMTHWYASLSVPQVKKKRQTAFILYRK